MNDMNKSRIKRKRGVNINSAAIIHTAQGLSEYLWFSGSRTESGIPVRGYPPDSERRNSRLHGIFQNTDALCGSGGGSGSHEIQHRKICCQVKNTQFKKISLNLRECISLLTWLGSAIKMDRARSDWCGLVLQSAMDSFDQQKYETRRSETESRDF